MSLDVYLKGDVMRVAARSSGIFIRSDGGTREITREEWDRLNPGREPVILEAEPITDILFHWNITHNLHEMAQAASLYEALWRPEEREWWKARDLIEPLRFGLANLEAHPEFFKQFNPANKWGDYDGLVDFVRRYLAACEEHPDAAVSVWR